MYQKHDDGYAELADWWIKKAHFEARSVIPKAIEYGATDLEDIGRALTRHTDPAYCTEAGIAFYALGKISRVMAAIREGRTPSMDTWHDLSIYAKMAMRVRETGGWPGPQTEQED